MKLIKTVLSRFRSWAVSQVITMTGGFPNMITDSSMTVTVRI